MNGHKRCWIQGAQKRTANPIEARFIGTMAVTEEGEAADVKHYLDEIKIFEEAQYDGFYDMQRSFR